MDKHKALNLLKEGNHRFFSPKIKSKTAKRKVIEKQTPFASVLACSDSRISVWDLFDADCGEIFTVRVAGNVCDCDEIATLEYGVVHLKTPVLIILGHNNCGAVTAAVHDSKLEKNLNLLVNKIKPAVNKAKDKYPEMKGDDLIYQSTIENIWYSIDSLLRKSSVVKRFLDEDKLLICGAIYDLNTGKVNWLEENKKVIK